MDIDTLWLRTLESVVSRAAHEVKDSLNGVSLNVEVIRSRAGRPSSDANGLAAFATSAAEQLELLTVRTEALLFLARPARGGGPADVAQTLRHLAALLVPAAKADGKRLSVDGYGRPAPTQAPAQATRLALASGLLSLIEGGDSGRCRLEQGDGTVVRFSHESAGDCSLDPAVAAAIAGQHIRIEQSRGQGEGEGGSELALCFP